MQPFWLTFTDGSQACCEGSGPYDAKQIAEHITGKTVAGGKYDNIDAKPLPYPAVPLIWQHDHPVVGKCPAFCYTPKECAGNGSCRKARSCCD
jgi:hypothetical protein